MTKHHHQQLVDAKLHLIYNTIFLSIAFISTCYMIWVIMTICKTSDDYKLATILEKHRFMIFMSAIFNFVASVVYVVKVVRYTFLIPVAFELVAVSANVAFSWIMMVMAFSIISNNPDWMIENVRQEMLHSVLIYIVQLMLILIYIITRWKLLLS